MRHLGRALAVALAVLAVGAVGAPPTATAADVEALRSEAQALGSQVSELEGELAELNTQAEDLRDRMEGTSKQLGFLELQKHELDQVRDEAVERYSARAIDAYKRSPAATVELLLGAESMSELLTIAEAQVNAADEDAAAVDDLLETREALVDRQEAIDERQVALAYDAERIDAIGSELESHVFERRAILDEIVSKLHEIERQARLAAAASARPSVALLRLLAPAGPAPGIPDGFAGTGVSFEGVASWYGPGFEGNSTANGDVFDPDLYTAASKDLPFGTWLYVTYGGRGVVVMINDRGPYVEGRILDLSQAAAEAVGLSGIGWIEAEILIRTDG
jgi:rare lipoprotein A